MNVLCIVVNNPTCGHVTDTILLRDPSGAVVDAVSYGISQDYSSRYVQAVAAGQLVSGEFIDVSGEFGHLVVGRDRFGADNDKMSDWDVGGGLNALCGSPLGRNNTLPSGPDLWVTFFQSCLTSAVSQPYFDLAVTDASFSGYGGNSEASVATHAMTFEGPLLPSGEWQMTGQISNSLEPITSSSYALVCQGTLSGSGGLSIDVTLRRDVGGAFDTFQIDVTVNDGVQAYPYSMSMSRQFAGVRGNAVITFTRVFDGWSGTSKTTNASQTVDWTLSNSGTVATTSSSLVYTRPYPLADGWVGNIGRAANSVTATETGYMDMTSPRSRIAGLS